MAGSGVTLYAVTAASNKTVIGTIDWREDVYMPSQINDNLGQIMADLRSLVNDIGGGFVEVGDGDGTYTATYVSPTSFRFDGVNVTPAYAAGRRVVVVAPTPVALLGTITSSVFSTHTTITVAWDGGALSNEPITAVKLGIGSADTARPQPVIAQCRLVMAIPTVIALVPWNGNQITINGLPQIIPSAGVGLTIPVVASTLSHVYLSGITGALTLSASATAPAADATTGQMILPGNPGIVYVGCYFTNASGQLQNDTTLRGVKSYYNKQQANMQAAASGSSTASATAVAISTSLVFIHSSDELIPTSWVGYAINPLINSYNRLHFILDATDVVVTTEQSAVASQPLNMSSGFPLYPGSAVHGTVHTVTVAGSVAGGTASYVGTHGMQVWI